MDLPTRSYAYAVRSSFPCSFLVTLVAAACETFPSLDCQYSDLLTEPAANWNAAGQGPQLVAALPL